MPLSEDRVYLFDNIENSSFVDPMASRSWAVTVCWDILQHSHTTEGSRWLEQGLAGVCEGKESVEFSYGSVSISYSVRCACVFRALAGKKIPRLVGFEPMGCTQLVVRSREG